MIAFRGSQENHAAGVIEALSDGFFPENEKGAHVKLHFHFTGEETEHKDRDEIRFTERSKVILIDAYSAKLVVFET